MITLGIILIVIALLVKSASILFTIGIILLIIGVVMNVISVGGRRWY